MVFDAVVRQRIVGSTSLTGEIFGSLCDFDFEILMLSLGTLIGCRCNYGVHHAKGIINLNDSFVEKKIVGMQGVLCLPDKT